MSKLIIILISLFSFSILFAGYGQNNDSVLKASINMLPTKLIIDTIKIQNFDNINESKVWYKDSNMPWLIAFLISIVGIIVNLLISYYQIRSTLKTNNIQSWVNETRNTLTEILTQARLLNIEYQEKQLNEDRLKIIHEKLTQNRTKLLLLLNPYKETHKVLLDSLRVLIDTLDEHLLNYKAIDEGINIPFDNLKFMNESNTVIENGRNLLYEDWKKIKSFF